MSQLLIQLNSPENEAILLALLPKLDAQLLEKNDTATVKKSFVRVAEEIASRGGVGQSFGDPSKWQREIRSWDRVLEGRGE